MNFVDIYQQYWKNGYVLTDTHLSGIDREMFRTLFNPVAEVFRKYPVGDVHLYLPGTGNIQGLATGNYQDSAGTTQAAADQPVGLVLDAAGSVGAEISTGNDFTGWSGGTGWTFSGGKARATAATGNASRLTTVTAGKTYKLVLRCDSYTSGGFKLLYEGGQSLVGDKTGAGTFEANLYANATGGLYIWVNTTLTATFDYISVREVTGIHASQQTVGYKPIERRGIVNLLMWSNDLTNAAWGYQNGAVKTSASSFTTTTADNSCVWQTVPNSVTGTTCTFACLLSGSGSINLFGYNGTNGYMGSTQITLTPTPTLYLIAISPTVNGSSVFMGNRFGNAATSVNFHGAGLFQGTLTTAQLLNAGGIPLTTTAPASSSAGVNYLEFKAANSNVLLLPSPAFQMADDHFVVASANFYGGGPALNKVIYSPAADSTPGSIKRLGQVAYDLGSARIQGSWYDGTNYDELHFAWPVGVPFIAATRKVGSALELWVNGVLRMTKTATATAFTANCGSIGAYPTSGAASYFDGAIYYADAIKGTVSNEELLFQCKLAATAAGIQL